MITISNLTKRYDQFTALDNVSVSVEKNEFVVFLGANGSGKSTLFKCLAGLTDYSGSIKVNGFDAFSDGKKVRSSIGFMSQYCGLHQDLTIEETVRFYSALRQVHPESGNQFLKQCSLFDRKYDKVGSLSGGMKQRLLFAVSLLGNPDILILDEPLASLDLASFRLIIEWLGELKSGGKTILVSTHLGSEIHDLADRFVILNEGKISNQPVTDFLTLYNIQTKSKPTILPISQTGTF